MKNEYYLRADVPGDARDKNDIPQAYFVKQTFILQMTDFNGILTGLGLFYE